MRLLTSSHTLASTPISLTGSGELETGELMSAALAAVWLERLSLP